MEIIRNKITENILKTLRYNLEGMNITVQDFHIKKTDSYLEKDRYKTVIEYNPFKKGYYSYTKRISNNNMSKDMFEYRHLRVPFLIDYISRQSHDLTKLGLLSEWSYIVGTEENLMDAYTTKPSLDDIRERTQLYLEAMVPVSSGIKMLITSKPKIDLVRISELNLTVLGTDVYLVGRCVFDDILKKKFIRENRKFSFKLPYHIDAYVSMTDIFDSIIHKIYLIMLERNKNAEQNKKRRR